jgi:hypothetical protein
MNFKRYDIVEAEFQSNGHTLIFRGTLMDFISREETEKYFPITISDIFGFCYTDVWLMNLKFLRDGKFISGEEVDRFRQNFPLGPAKLKTCRVVLVEKDFKKNEYEVIQMCF